MGHVEPINYSIHLTPDLSSFSFTGELNLTLKKQGTIDKIKLDALDLEFVSVEINSNPIPFEYDLETELLTLTLPPSLPDEFKVTFTYTGEINDKLAGLYRSPYQENGETKYFAITQFQEKDARRVFPCFDSPERKATFNISTTLDEQYEPLSNTSIVEEKKLGDGKKLVSFEQTPLMSTYLVFFGFGDFDFIEDSYRGIPIRVVTSPGKAEKYGKLGLEFTKKSLKYCEEFFGIDYPLSKLDVIASPAFAAGAMENWGAITFRENVLLYYPGITSIRDVGRIKEVIAHEVTHQWFGNLVSPNSWKYTWLNESFATFFAYGIVDHYEPEYHMWEFFVTDETLGAFSADAYFKTAPIEIEGTEKVSYSSITIPIFYNKGGSVLRQIRGYLGEETFKKGLRLYLTKNAYSVAGSKDLWDGLQEASGEPIADLMSSWILQKGYPVVTAKRIGNSLHLSQSRFTFLPNNEDTLWHIPLTLKYYFNDGRSRDENAILSEKEMTLTLPEGVKAVKINRESTGFYRVQYDDTMLSALTDMIKAKNLSTIDRWSIENDYYAFLAAAKISLDAYLDLINNYKGEDSHLSMQNLALHLYNLYDYSKGDLKERIRQLGVEILESFIDGIGLDKQEGEHHTLTIVRGRLFRIAGILGSRKVIDHAMKLFEKIKQGENIDANVFSSVIGIAARETNDFNYFADKFKNAESEVEIIHYGNALAEFTTPENIEKVQEYIFSDIPQRNRSMVITNLCYNEKAKPSIWEWFMANLDNFGSLNQWIFQRSVMAIMDASFDKEEEMQSFFEDYVKKHKAIADTVSKSFETVKIKKQVINHINS